MFKDVEDTQGRGFDVTIPPSPEKFFKFLVLLRFFTDLVLKLGQPALHPVTRVPSLVQCHQCEVCIWIVILFGEFLIQLILSYRPIRTHTISV
jgi:hypothetical protein